MEECTGREGSREESMRACYGPPRRGREAHTGRGEPKGGGKEIRVERAHAEVRGWAHLGHNGFGGPGRGPRRIFGALLVLLFHSPADGQYGG